MTKMTSQKKLLALGAVISGGVAGYGYTKMGSDDEKDGSKVANENGPILVGGSASNDESDVIDPSKEVDALESVNQEDPSKNLLKDCLEEVVGTGEDPEDE